MKKILCLSVLAVLVSASGSVLAADGSWTGWLADENCAKDYSKSASAGHAGCAKGCLRKGAKWALSLQDALYILDIDVDEAEKHLGHEVTIKGNLDESNNTIKVTTVAATD